MKKSGKKSKAKGKSTTQRIDCFVQVKYKPGAIFIVVLGLVDRRSHYYGSSTLILDIKRLKRDLKKDLNF